MDSRKIDLDFDKLRIEILCIRLSLEDFEEHIRTLQKAVFIQQEG